MGRTKDPDGGWGRILGPGVVREGVREIERARVIKYNNMSSADIIKIVIGFFCTVISGLGLMWFKQGIDYVKDIKNDLNEIKLSVREMGVKLQDQDKRIDEHRDWNRDIEKKFEALKDKFLLNRQ